MDKSKFGYIEKALSLDDIIEELDEYVKDLNTAQFKATFNLQIGISEGYDATMKVIEALIDVLEEHSPNPSDDPLIDRLYNTYDALERIKDKCKYI